LALLCIRAHIGYEFGWTYLFLDKDSMTDQRKAAKWQGIAPRVVTDFLIIHCAMLVAFAISVSYQTHGQAWPSADDLADAFRRYYLSWFLILSPVFPLVFYMNGFYTYVRPLAAKEKLKKFTLVVMLSLAVFISANFLVVQQANPVGRSVALTFGLFALLGLVGVRVGKELLLGDERADQKDRSKAASQGPVLVIGGAGYVGCWLIRRLLEEGKSVRVLDNAVYGLDPIRDLLQNPRVEYLNGDCRNIQDVVKAVRGVSSIVHLAAIVGDPACEIDHKTTIEINYAATRMIVEVAKGHGVERFLFASSCSVYGATDEIMDENSKVEPVSLYGQLKVAAEQALLEAASDDFHPVLLRFATVFGLSNRPRFDLVVNLLSAKAWQDGVITIYNGEQWRPFVHVKDLSEAIILLLSAPLRAVSQQTFNVGDNSLNHTLTEVGEVIRRVFPGTRIEGVENADKRNYRVNFDKIEKRLGFRCRYHLEDGVREIKAAFDSSAIDNYKNIRFSNLGFLRQSGTPANKSEFDAEIMAAFGGEHIRRAATPFVKSATTAG
jgi:nucleoside-diphosphate-sugar epimerase